MSNKDEVKFKYIFSDDYNPIYVNGAFGGINLQGEIVINFYLERHGLPISQSFEIKKDGKLGNEIGKEPEDLRTSMIRFVQSGIILNLINAKKIHKWLGGHIAKLEQLSKLNKNQRRK